MAQLSDSLHHVHLLRTVGSRTALPEIPLVEEVHDNHADCMYLHWYLTRGLYERE